jgi:hypothetical protein
MRKNLRRLMIKMTHSKSRPWSGRRDLARLLSMSAGITTQLRTPSLPISRSLMGAVVAFALLLQALFAMPLALRMTADEMQWLQLGASICATTTDGALTANGHRPIHRLPAHNHAQCLICQAHALPLGLLAVVLCVLVALFSQVSIRCSLTTGPLWRRDRYHSYRSRAPPIVA